MIKFQKRVQTTPTRRVMKVDGATVPTHLSVATHHLATTIQVAPYTSLPFLKE